MRNASGLYWILNKLKLKTADYNMRYPSWLHKLTRNIEKKQVIKEIKGYEQEIKDRKTEQRS
jgi:hypothetical protein